MSGAEFRFPKFEHYQLLCSWNSDVLDHIYTAKKVINIEHIKERIKN